MTRTAVRAETPAGPQEWIVHSSEEEPWTIRAVAPDGRSFEAEGADLFVALQRVRERTEKEGVLLCCNGARTDARPSPQSGASGGGMVYLLPSLRNPVPADLVPLLAPAPAAQVGSVAEQEAFWASYRSSFRSALRAFSPVAPAARLMSRFRRPPARVAVERDGVTVWTGPGTP